MRVNTLAYPYLDMNELSVADDSSDPDSQENQLPKGSSIRSTAWRDPTTSRAKARTRRYLLLGTQEAGDRLLGILALARSVRL
jgi:hypothetical protein